MYVYIAIPVLFQRRKESFKKNPSSAYVSKQTLKISFKINSLQRVPVNLRCIYLLSRRCLLT